MRAVLLGLIGLTLAAPLAALPTKSARPEAKTVQQHWECVPIARSLSGIQIYGDARTWWGQAEGRYRRGNMPKKGAVLSFKPYGSMELGHVAAVSKIIDKRTILVTHSNWSPINGRRGQIERNVQVVDVSDRNDWSRVRVWFAPLQDLGTTHWPVHGFIYPNDAAPLKIPSNAVVANVPNKKPEAMPKNATKAPGVAVKKPLAPAKSALVKPTGKLDYMGKMLSKIEKQERRK